MLVAPGSPAAASPAPDEVGTLIIGGEEAQYARAMVSIHKNGGRFTCSGVAVRVGLLVVVATAAHCATVMTGDPSVPPPVVPDLALRVGKDRNAGPLIQAHRVAVMHGWTWGAGGPNVRVSDAAIIKPAGPLPGVVPVALGMSEVGKRVQMLGWGVTDLAGTPPVMVQAATGDTVAVGNCQGMDPVMTAGEVCVKGRDAYVCFGDSGGPILGWDKVRGLSVLGLASRAYEDCSGTTVYTAVDGRFHKWAHEVARSWALAA